MMAFAVGAAIGSLTFLAGRAWGRFITRERACSVILESCGYFHGTTERQRELIACGLCIKIREKI